MTQADRVHNTSPLHTSPIDGAFPGPAHAAHERNPGRPRQVWCGNHRVKMEEAAN